MRLVGCVHRITQDQIYAALNVGCFCGNTRIGAMQMLARAELGPEVYTSISSIQS